MFQLFHLEDYVLFLLFRLFIPIKSSLLIMILETSIFIYFHVLN